jgi:hypothetical protein
VKRSTSGTWLSLSWWPVLTRSQTAAAFTAGRLSAPGAAQEIQDECLAILAKHLLLGTFASMSSSGQC